MRLKGEILNWNDDKGFGFVEPIGGGGKRAFVHVKAFKIRSRRPANGEIIFYELVRENNGRYKAENIKFARGACYANPRNLNKQHKAKNGSVFGSVLVILFCIGLLLSTFSGKLPLIIVGVYIVISFITFIAYAIDKSAAQNDRWRTKESTLHILSLIGGWPGAFYAQKKLRHKSNKKEFKNVYWITVLLNLSGLFWLHTEQGINFLNVING